MNIAFIFIFVKKMFVIKVLARFVLEIL